MKKVDQSFNHLLILVLIHYVCIYATNIDVLLFSLFSYRSNNKNNKDNY